MRRQPLLAFGAEREVHRAPSSACMRPYGLDRVAQRHAGREIERQRHRRVLALEAARAAIDTCKGIDQKVAVSVLDSAGELRLLLAADGTPSRSVANSGLKVKAALAFNIPSGQVAERVKTDKDAPERRAANPTWLARAGALPVSVGGTVIGAIGVGDARGSDKDEDCAIAGLDKVKSRLY